MEEITSMFTKPSFVFDMICVVLVLVLALRYARKGLLATLVGLVGNLASMIGANLFANWAAPWLFTNLMAAGFREKIAATLAESGSVDLAALAQQYAGFLPDSFRQSVVESVSGALAGSLQSNAAQMAGALVTEVIQPLITPVLSIVLFFVAFALCRMVVSLLGTVMGLVNRIPVLGTVNRGLGFVGGFMAGAVDLFLVLCVVWALIVVTGGSLPLLNDQVLASSWFYQLFSRLNPFAAA